MRGISIEVGQKTEIERVNIINYLLILLILWFFSGCCKAHKHPTPHYSPLSEGDSRLSFQVSRMWFCWFVLWNIMYWYVLLFTAIFVKCHASYFVKCIHLDFYLIYPHLDNDTNHKIIDTASVFNLPHPTNTIIVSILELGFSFSYN